MERRRKHSRLLKRGDKSAEDVSGEVSLTAVLLGQQRVQVQLRSAAVSFLASPCPEEVLHSAVSRVHGLNGAPGGGVQLQKVRGQTLPYQEDTEVPNSP